MTLWKRVAGASATGLLCLAVGTASPRVGPSRANFDRLLPGMTLVEVESILGPAGPSLSSIRALGLPYEAYYIWKGRDGWIRVWAINNQVTRLEFDPSLTIDDPEGPPLNPDRTAPLSTNETQYKNQD